MVWIKRYAILSMPLHLFQDDANCCIDNNHVETLNIWEKGVGLFTESRQTLVRWDRFGMRHQAKNIELPHWTFVRHHCFMKYQLDKGRGEWTYKGWSKGMFTYVWMPRESLGCAGVHRTCNVTNKVHKKIFLHSVQEEFHENYSDLNYGD